MALIYDNELDVNYIRSCIKDHKIMFDTYRNTRNNIMKQIEVLSEEESALVLPGGNGDNLGIRSTGIVDTAYENHAKLAQANIFARKTSLMKNLDHIEDRMDALHRVLQMFHMVALVYPMHYCVSEAYLYKSNEDEKKAIREDSGYRKLETEYGSSHKTLRAMVNNVCEMVRELVIADCDGANVALLSPAGIKDKLSKELVAALDKLEYNQRKRNN